MSLSSVVASSRHVWPPVIVRLTCAARYCFAALVKLFSAVVRFLASINTGSPVVIGSAGFHCASV